MPAGRHIVRGGRRRRHALESTATGTGRRVCNQVAGRSRPVSSTWSRRYGFLRDTRTLSLRSATALGTRAARHAVPAVALFTGAAMLVVRADGAALAFLAVAADPLVHADAHATTLDAVTSQLLVLASARSAAVNTPTLRPLVRNAQIAASTFLAVASHTLVHANTTPAALDTSASLPIVVAPA